MPLCSLTVRINNALVPRLSLNSRSANRKDRNVDKCTILHVTVKIGTPDWKFMRREADRRR